MYPCEPSHPHPQDVVAGSGIDAYYPVRGFKRYRSDELGYEFVYPQEWVADQTVALAKQQRGVQSLDPAAPRRAPKRSSTIPDAAFGPMGNLNRSGVCPLPLPHGVPLGAPANLPCVQRTSGIRGTYRGGGGFRGGIFPRGKFRVSTWCGIFPSFFEGRCGILSM